MTSVTIRSFEESELGALHRVDQLVFGQMAYPPFVLRQVVALNSRYCVVADGGDMLVGYGIGGLAVGERVGWVLGLGVVDHARGEGYAYHLIREVIRRLIADGAEDVRLSVKPENVTAVRLYRTLGFRATGVRPDYFGPGEDRLIMDVTAAEFRDFESSGADESGAWLTGETQNPWLGFGETDLPR